jgi:inhibitor of cysteine peptidase
MSKIVRNEITIIVLTTFVLLTSCAMIGESELDDVRLNVNNDGRIIINLEEGQRLVITLGANPTTGYIWEVVELNETILVKTYEEFQPESDMDGAPGEMNFGFQAVSPGQTMLKFVHHRPWEVDVEPLSIFSLNVIIR